MAENKRRWFVRGGVFVFLAGLFGGVFLLSMNETPPVRAQDRNTPAANAAVNGREKSNVNMLASLLSSDAVTVTEADLLPARVGSSKTIVVSLESTENSSNAEFQAQSPRNNLLSLVEIKEGKGGLARQRSVDLSPDQVLVLAVDQNKHTLWWDLVPDPRVFHAESADDTGKLSGQKVFKSTATLLASFPSDKRIIELRFYHPNWDGKAFDLQLISSLALPANGQ